MEKVISKLKEIKQELINLNDSATNAQFTALKKRIMNIAKRQFGEFNDYTKSMRSISDTVYDSNIDRVIGIADLLIDELELQEVKETKLKEPILKQEERNIEQKVINAINSNIFIVHGHNDVMREKVARTVEKLGLKPIILHEQANTGDTIIEKLTRNSNVNFAIVLLSADDKGGLKTDSLEKMQFRARQNVIFELGYFIGKLGRKRVIALFEDIKNFDFPTDYQGIVYIPYKKNSDDWKLKLSQELIESGYSIDLNKLLG